MYASHVLNVRYFLQTLKFLSLKELVPPLFLSKYKGEHELSYPKFYVHGMHCGQN